MVRRFLVWLHRWAGLLMTVFLILVGLTGSVLAFKLQVERLVCPRIYAAARPGVPMLDLATLAERAAAIVPQGEVTAVNLFEPGHADVVFDPRQNPQTGRPYELGFTELFLDPWTGKELGRRRWGDLSQGLINLVPFIYNLHVTLLLGTTGVWALGVVALIWTIDCFNGFYLTLPLSRTSFWRRWKPAWLVKWNASALRMNFDLHRAGGLWLWLVLLVFAWSSVMLNLRPVYDRVTAAVIDYQPISFPMNPHPSDKPRLDFRAALSAGERLMEEQAKRYHFSLKQPLLLSHFSGLYWYYVRSSRDINDRLGVTIVGFDEDTGALKMLNLPPGQHTGNVVTSWLDALHMADVFGLPYRVFVCLLGLIIVMLSVTGVYIWWKKRKARLHRPGLRRARSAEALLGEPSSRGRLA